MKTRAVKPKTRGGNPQQPVDHSNRKVRVAKVVTPRKVQSPTRNQPVVVPLVNIPARVGLPVPLDITAKSSTQKGTNVLGLDALDGNPSVSSNQKAKFKDWSIALLTDRKGCLSQMVESLEMIIDFAYSVVKEPGVGKPGRMTWTEGIHGKDEDKDTYALKMLLLLICSRRATDESLRKLEPLLNHPDFGLDYIIGMEKEQLVDLIKPIGFQNINADCIQETFLRIRHRYDGSVTRVFRDLMLCQGVGNKIALLVLQYAYDSIEVSRNGMIHEVVFTYLCDTNNHFRCL